MSPLASLSGQTETALGLSEAMTAITWLVTSR